jgi:nitrile hydratase beta subunit
LPNALAIDDNFRARNEMNGVHDMGGMDGFGAVTIERDEPVFHSEWEKRMFAIAMTLTGHPRGLNVSVDEFRHAIERIPAPRYLDSSYYEHWLDALLTLLAEHGVVAREELASRGTDPIDPALPANHLATKVKSSKRVRARFRQGDRVVARNINPSGHTRLPRYVRGKRGVIHRDWGVYVFADTNAHHAGDHSQHVYSVAFEARELWGNGVPRRDKLHIDLWEDYLEADSPVKSGVKKSSARTKRRKKK